MRHRGLVSCPGACLEDGLHVQCVSLLRIAELGPPVPWLGEISLGSRRSLPLEALLRWIVCARYGRRLVL